MDGLYRFVCGKCDAVFFGDDHSGEDISARSDTEGNCPECDNKYAALLNTPSKEHDEQIMEAPPDHFACPDCGSAIYALSDETGKYWSCWTRTGGCGYAGWAEDVPEIRAPNEVPHEESTRRSAWSRYHRHEEGNFEYRD